MVLADTDAITFNQRALFVRRLRNGASFRFFIVGELKCCFPRSGAKLALSAFVTSIKV